MDERNRPKSEAEIRELVAEAGQIKMSTLLAPFLAAAAVIGATAGATVVLMKVFGA